MKMKWAKGPFTYDFNAPIEPMKVIKDNQFEEMLRNAHLKMATASGSPSQEFVSISGLKRKIKEFARRFKK